MSLQADATEKADRILHFSDKMKLHESLMLDSFKKMVDNPSSNPKGVMNESNDAEVETEEVSSNQNEIEQHNNSNTEDMEDKTEPRTEKKTRFRRLFSRKNWRTH